MQLTELLAKLDSLLEPSKFKDYAPNGLQIEGRPVVNKLVTGVTASQELIEVASERGADAILVHHGYFWKGEDARITGIKGKRIKTLLQNDISLLAYHLPLDAHLDLGNNARLGAALGLSSPMQAGEYGLLWHGDWQESSAVDFTKHVSSCLGRQAQLLGRPDKQVGRVAWCTGGAQNWFAEAIALGVDAFITGEVSEQNYHMALECDVAFIAAGHHATERFGVQALGEYLGKALGIEVEFIDIFNPI
ncbi:Nif3-like dinuclear metal center hexameric protein [Neisseriaceae bacterium TC5R-5]|nr:Nif3-like dinuclear metal center hexameric protein [Neisseriaceae bacterium TC5R-5]